jgi:hypothetical protein
MPTIDVSYTTLYYDRSGDGPCSSCTARSATPAAGPGRHSGSMTATPSCGTTGAATAAGRPAPPRSVMRCTPTTPRRSSRSSGAAIGLEVALRHSHLLRGAVLSEPPLFSVAPGGGQALLGSVVPRVEQAIAAGGPRAAVDAFLSSPARASGR